MTKKLSENPNVFLDFHHAGLLQSFILFFEKRLGGKVYRPIGMDWATKGFWKVYDHPATQLQFLTMDQGYRPIDGTLPLNNIQKVENGVYYCQDIDSGYYNRAITFDKFLSMDIDIIIASMPQHIDPFVRLQNQHKPNAKLIYQIGNNWNVDGSMMINNVMASAKVEIPAWINSIVYHQEFDKEIFYYRDPVNTRNIFSFINCFNTQEHFKQDWQLFETVEKLLPDWNFKSYGGQCRDGSQDGSRNLSTAMVNSRFIWHTKNQGDGYGHILFNTASIGRPTIIKFMDYKDKLGEKLLIDGETCIAIDNLSEYEIVNKINFYNQPDEYRKLAKNIRENFKQKVDFDREAMALKDFIDNLK